MPRPCLVLGLGSWANFELFKDLFFGWGPKQQIVWSFEQGKQISLTCSPAGLTGIGVAPETFIIGILHS